MCIGNGVKVKKEFESTSYVVHALGLCIIHAVSVAISSFFVNYTVWFHAVDCSCVYDAEQRHYSQYVNYYAPAQGALSDDAV